MRSSGADNCAIDETCPNLLMCVKRSYRVSLSSIAALSQPSQAIASNGCMKSLRDEGSVAAAEAMHLFRGYVVHAVKH